MEKRNAQLNTQCDISVFTETEIGKQDKSFQKNKGCEYILGGGTVCSNGFYADISNQRQMQQYKLCLKSFLSNFGSSDVP